MPPRKPLWSRGRVVRRGDKYAVIIPIEDIPHHFGREVELAECVTARMARVVIHRCSMAQASMNAANLMIETAQLCHKMLLNDEPTLGVIELLRKRGILAREVLDSTPWAPDDTSVEDLREIPRN